MTMPIREKKKISLEEFEEIFFSSVNDIKEEYYQLGERIYCYELYNLLKKNIETSNFVLDTLSLHGELIKSNNLSEDELNRFNITQLSSRLSPDFLLHNNDNTDEQLMAIEIKTNDKLYNALIKKDLAKLHMIIANYRFKKGIFLAINFSMARIKNIIAKNYSNYENLNPNIIIVTKADRNSEIEKKDLGEILEAIKNNSSVNAHGG